MQNEFYAVVQKMEPAIGNAPFREKLRVATDPKKVIEILIEEFT